MADADIERNILTAEKSLPVTHGSLLDFARDPLLCMRQLNQTHGTVAALEDGNKRLVFVFGPEHNQRVLSDPKTFHSQFFAIRGPKNSAQRHLTCGLLSMNGEDHKRHRRLVMASLQKGLLDTYRHDVVSLSEQMVQEWQAGQVRNIFRDMTRYMLRVASSVTFGFDMQERAYEIGHLIERWVAMNHEVGMGAFVSDAAITVSYEGLLTLATELAEKIRAMIEYRRSTAALGNDVLSQFLRPQEDTGAPLTDAELIGQTTVVFGAAHLTTASTLTWTVFLLAQHPEIATALVQELDDVLGGRTPTLQELDQLPLLDHVIKESMRILPASAYSHRVNAEPVDIGPLHVKKGTPVIFSQIISHHMPDTFPEPDRFLPDRWRTLSPSPYAYLPFAAGPRMCVGASLAIMTLKLTLSAILQRYHLGVVPGASINGKVTFTMFCPTSGMPMLVLPRTAPFRGTAVGGNIHNLVRLPNAPDAERSTAVAA